MYEKITLANGVRILTERVPGMRSAALGIWVGTGSRDEKAAENGAAHFIEHMVFKGTARRTAAQLAQEMDAIGGQVNAFTTKECTCFHARVLDDHLPRAIDLLCDMLLSSNFAESDVATERGVILEEIGMYADNPEDLCAERLAAAVYRGNPLARPILGKKSTLEKMDGRWLRDYMASHYTPDKIVVALAGSFHSRDVDDLSARFSALAAAGSAPFRRGAYQPAFTLKKKAIEQNHLTIAFPGLSYDDPDRFALQLLSAALGSGLSSRLWQEVRERRGLCYSIYTYSSDHADTGFFGIYTALGRDTEGQALETIRNTVADFADHGVTAEELSRAQDQARTNVLMGLESTQAHMSALGRGELMLGKVLSTDEVLERYASVTREDVRRLAGRIFDFDRVSLSAVGRVSDEEQYRRMLANG